MKRNKILYWIATLWLALGMASTGVVQMLGLPAQTKPILEMGYPAYFLIILGVWKILGVVALLVPGFLLVKEWAYAGFVFTTTGALCSHIASGHGVGEMFPALLLLILTMASWCFRPSDRKIVPAIQEPTA